MKLSQYAHERPLSDGGLVLYSARTTATLQLSAEEAREFISCRDCGDFASLSFLKTLRSAQIVVENDLDEFGGVMHDAEVAQSGSQSIVLVVAPTMACNFACDYCFQTEHFKSLMSAEVSAATLAFLKQLLRKSGAKTWNLVWYGGEPLMAQQVITGLMGEVKGSDELNDRLRECSVVTNGYLLTPRVSHQLVDLGVNHIQVTLAGDEIHHNSLRPLLSGRGSYGQILDNLVGLPSELQCDLHINIDGRNSGSLSRLLGDLDSRGILGRPNFRVELFRITGGKHTLSVKEFAYLQVNFHEQLKTLGVDQSTIPSPVYGFCEARNAYNFVLRYDGLLFKCWEDLNSEERVVGSVFKPEAIIYASDPTKGIAPTSECSSCPVLPICLNGCPLQREFGQDCSALKHNVTSLLPHIRTHK